MYGVGFCDKKYPTNHKTPLAPPPSYLKKSLVYNPNGIDAEWQGRFSWNNKLLDINLLKKYLRIEFLHAKILHI